MPTVKEEAFKLREFSINGNHVLLLAVLRCPLTLESWPTDLVVKVVINGNTDDEVNFVLDWSTFCELDTVDEAEQLHLVELNEDLMSPRARDSGA